MALIRGLVSKKKIRYQKDGFDLDLTYITPRIIAMGFPSEGSEAAYRNPMEDVQKFFNQYHEGDKMRIINLCSERAYEPSKFGGDKHVCRYPFDDHNPAPLSVIHAACEDMAAFLEEDESHVVAIHCKAGKGRTGMMIACLLRRLEVCKSAMEALKYFADKRTSNSKGVTIPSQMRYVHYYEQSLKIGAIPEPKTYRVTHIRLITIPNLDVMGGCDPYFDVRACLPKDASDPTQGIDMIKYYNYFDEMGKKVKNYMPKHKYADLDLTKLSKPLYVRGDVKFVFYDYDRFSADDKAMHFWFNTAFVSNNYLLFHKEVVDRACKDKECAEFDPDFKVEVFMEPVDVAFDPRKEGKAVSDDKDDPAGDDDEEVPGGAGAASGGAGS